MSFTGIKLVYIIFNTRESQKQSHETFAETNLIILPREQLDRRTGNATEHMACYQVLAPKVVRGPRARSRPAVASQYYVPAICTLISCKWQAKSFYYTKRCESKCTHSIIPLPHARYQYYLVSMLWCQVQRDLAFISTEMISQLPAVYIWSLFSLRAEVNQQCALVTCMNEDILSPSGQRSYM